MSEKPPIKPEVMEAKRPPADIEKPITKPVQEVIDFAVSFASLSNMPQGKLRMRRGVGDLMHTMGYYIEQTRKVGGKTSADRLDHIVAALKHISDNLTKD